MQCKGKKQIIASLIFLFHLAVVCTQAQEYDFSHVTPKDGLSSNFVRCVAKDSRGFMWFGTTAGLDRYDGYEIISYQNIPGDSTSISGNSIKTIININEGLLIGTVNAGLNVFDFQTKTFTSYVHDPNDSTSISHNNVKAICLDSTGKIWIGTPNGMNIFHPVTGTFQRIVLSNEPSNSKKNEINEIFCDFSGALWIGTNDGLYQFDEQDHVFNQVELIPTVALVRFEGWERIINAIHQDKDSAIWIGTDYSLFSIKGGIQEWYGFNKGENKSPSNIYINNIVSVSHSGFNELWLATHWGLNKLDLNSGIFTHFFSDPNNDQSVSHNDINHICVEDNRLLWLGGSDGVDILKLRNNEFHHHITRFGNFGYSAVTFHEDSDGIIWVGSPNVGLLKYDHNLNLMERCALNIPNGDTARVYSVFQICEDSESRMWIGMNKGYPGFYLFDRKKEFFTKIPCDTSNSHPEPFEFKDIQADQQGTIWFATNLGLYFIDPSVSDSLYARYADHDILSKAYIRDLYLDQHGNLFISSHQGFFVLISENNMNREFNFISQFDIEKPHDHIPFCMVQTSDSKYWIGTATGLYTMDSTFEIFKRVAEYNEFISHNKIYSMVEDKSGCLWLSSIKGLIRFNPHAAENESPKLFDHTDGLPYQNLSWYDLFLCSDGRIFIPGAGGNQNGFVFFYPDSLYFNKEPPPIVITEINIKGETLDYPGIINENRLLLKHKQNFFSFRFSALDYTDPEKNQYAYFLEGFEEAWNYSGNRRTANYTNVPPGDYLLRVKGSNNDGFWNLEGTTLSVTILPPPWLTWWAYTLYCLALIGLIVTWRRYDLKRQRLKQQLEIEHLEAEKLKELDSIKSRFFANISHEFRTPLTLILGPIEKLKAFVKDLDPAKDLDIMQRNAHRLQTLINQLLNLSKLESGQMKLKPREENLVALVRNYTQSFESLAKQKQIDLFFKSDADIIRAWVDRDKIENILYNLLSNAIKFTPAGGQIVVEITAESSSVQEGHFKAQSISEAEPSPLSTFQSEAVVRQGRPGRVKIKVSDTGRGIPPKKLPHIFDRFYQADDSYSRDQEGSGIGLALTSELVELHHGRIGIESIPGKGTICIVLLPLGKCHLKEEEIANTDFEDARAEVNGQHKYLKIPAEDVALSDDETGDSRKPLLLIVEDNDDMRSYIRSYLADAYRISEANNGKMGLEKAIEAIPDLVISDVMMPEMDGNEMCAKLKSDERTSHIPVIILTARASMQSKIQGLETGADDFITKPFDSHELKVRVKNLIVQRKKLHDRFIKKIQKTGLDHMLEIENEDFTPPDQQFMQRVVNIILKYLSDPEFDVERLSSAMNLSRMQVYRKLAGLTGYTPGNFIRCMRLNKAAEMLSRRVGKVSEIAFDVGFNNLSYFTKCFKEQFGVLPSEYNTSKETS